VSWCNPCPLCGVTAREGHGHACVPKPYHPLASLPPDWPYPKCENGCVRPCRCAPLLRGFGALPPDLVAKKPRRTVCADCRWYRTSGYDSRTFTQQRHVCGHENARNLITGEPTSCSRNLGNCPDYQEKQP